MKKNVDEVPGFGTPSENDVQPSWKTKKNKSGGFQSMGFNYSIMKGIKNKGYNLPTPIQRKTIPLIRSGRDVVAMARTGSGKTACFILPILEKLSSDKKAVPGRNLRSLILSPTRELALQTLRFIRDLGRFTGLRAASALGGDSLDEQFSVLSGVPPDILVATPGRLLHLLVEMDSKLNDLQMLVFDEADRLFELGFEEQLRELMARMSTSRQTLLFSATLPKNLVEFARAGLQEPALVRLNADWKLPKQLSLSWISVRDEQRTAALLLLLEKILVAKRRHQTPQAIVFTATKHHVEYIQLILNHAGITCAGVHSGLDPSARKVALGRFAAHRASILVVTDVAARGLDLPELQFVINYQLPATSKLFVHRAGRTARASASGVAYSLVAPIDGPHILDLELFLGAKIKNIDDETELEASENTLGLWGSVPTDELDVQHSNVLKWHDQPEIEEAYERSQRAWQKYMRCKEAASPHSNKRAKHLRYPVAPHPVFASSYSGAEIESEQQQQQFVAKIHTFKPRGTIFELGGKNDSADYVAMRRKRVWSEKAMKSKIEHDSQIEEELKEVLQAKKSKRLNTQATKDPNYIPHQPDDAHTESGLSVNFAMAARGASLDLRGDEDGRMKKSGRGQFGESRGKRGSGNEVATIRGESGAKVPASLRSGRYQQWKKRQNGGDELPEKSTKMRDFRPNWVKHNERIARKQAFKESGELRSTQQMLNERIRKDKIKTRQKKGGKKKKGRK